MADNRTNPIVPGRSCGDCTLCCKLLAIKELAKPRNVWCKHCKPGSGCLIYDSRPGDCAIFNCGYLISPILGEEWKPNKCKIVLVPGTGVNRIVAFVDPQRPDVWKREPYYTSLKKLAANAAAHGGWVIVRIERRTYMLYPDRDLDLGEVDDEAAAIGGIPSING